jgi:hypothetical protein
MNSALLWSFYFASNVLAKKESIGLVKIIFYYISHITQKYSRHFFNAYYYNEVFLNKFLPRNTHKKKHSQVSLTDQLMAKIYKLKYEVRFSGHLSILQQD